MLGTVCVPFLLVVRIDESQLPIVITKMLSGGRAMAWWRIPSAWFLKAQSPGRVYSQETVLLLSAWYNPWQASVVFIWSSRIELLHQWPHKLLKLSIHSLVNYIWILGRVNECVCVCVSMLIITREPLSFDIRFYRFTYSMSYAF